MTHQSNSSRETRSPYPESNTRVPTPYTCRGLPTPGIRRLCPGLPAARDAATRHRVHRVHRDDRAQAIAGDDTLCQCHEVVRESSEDVQGTSLQDEIIQIKEARC